MAKMFLKFCSKIFILLRCYKDALVGLCSPDLSYNGSNRRESVDGGSVACFMEFSALASSARTLHGGVDHHERQQSCQSCFSHCEAV